MSVSRSRILLISRNFPPQVGGMERLIHHLLLELASEFRLALVAPEGSDRYAPDAEVYACPLSPIARFLWSCQIMSMRAASRFRPDLVIAGSGVAAPAALLAARRAGARVACYLHGLDLAARSAVYRSIFLPAVRRCDLLIVNSNHTRTLAEAAGVAPERIRVLHPGVSLPTGNTDAAGFRAFAGISSESPILLAVGRLVPRKGLAEFVRRVLPRIVEQRPDVVLAVIGSEPANALWHRGGERERIEREAAVAGVATNVRLLDNVSDARLREAYASARLLVLPLQPVPGDVEGFGMVALEAAAHGLPTVAFALGGVTDAVRDGESGHLIAPGDEEAFARAVLLHLMQEAGRWGATCRRFAESFAWARFGERARTICHELVATAGQRA